MTEKIFHPSSENIQYQKQKSYQRHKYGNGTLLQHQDFSFEFSRSVMLKIEWVFFDKYLLLEKPIPV